MVSKIVLMEATRLQYGLLVELDNHIDLFPAKKHVKMFLCVDGETLDMLRLRIYVMELKHAEMRMKYVHTLVTLWKQPVRYQHHTRALPNGFPIV